jgi:FkbM family methyltransferase
MKKLIKKAFNYLGFDIIKAPFNAFNEKPIHKQKRKKASVGKYELLANEAHQIGELLKRHHEYSRNLPRIAAILSEKWADFGIIDIGANIGDTVALLRSEGVENTIYCIEPVNYYFDLLSENTRSFSHVKCFNLWLDDIENEKIGPLSIEVKNGTARHIENGKATEFNKTTLDEFVDNQALTNIKLLKIDTDGFDFKIIRSGFNFIKKQKPVLFFEYDVVHLAENNDDAWQTLAILRDEMGYDQALYFDNFGRFLCAISLKNDERQAKQLLRYIQNYKGAFPYFDVCLLQGNDADLADKIIQKEESRN